MPGCGALHFVGQFRGYLEVLALTQIQQIRNYFPPKNHVLLSNFFSSSNMFFIRLFLANTWEKKLGVTVLVSSQTAVKGCLDG